MEERREFDALPMIATHCPICRSGPKLDCSDMKRCPLILAKFRGEFISAEDFARQHGVAFSAMPVEEQSTKTEQVGQLTLF